MTTLMRMLHKVVQNSFLKKIILNFVSGKTLANFAAKLEDKTKKLDKLCLGICRFL